ncbi:hypothetical protein [Sulfurimonas sp. NWX79]|nr:hypothetical protein IAPFLPAM_00012 [Sulfurimonas phage SNW-1]
MHKRTWEKANTTIWDEDMKINTLYDIDDLVEIMRSNTEYGQCECCGTHTSVSLPDTKEVARIERIEITKKRIQYGVRFVKNNAGSMYLYSEDKILNRVLRK